MAEYFLRLFILLPVVAGLAWGSLWLWRKMQQGGTFRPDRRLIARTVEVLPMGTQGKMAVIEFGDQHLLVGVSRTQINLIASKPRKGDEAVSGEAENVDAAR